MYEYPTAHIPVGTRFTILHFSNGLFFRTVDFTACRDGLYAERIVAMPVVAGAGVEVVDCRAARREKQQGGELGERKSRAPQRNGELS